MLRTVRKTGLSLVRVMSLGTLLTSAVVIALGLVEDLNKGGLKR